MKKYLRILFSAATIGLLGACTSASDSPQKNVIFFLGDGMGITVQSISRRQHKKRPANLRWQTFFTYEPCLCHGLLGHF